QTILCRRWTSNLPALNSTGEVRGSTSGRHSRATHRVALGGIATQMGETTIDYDGLIAAAIGNLNNNTAALRHALYNHAEKALICELRKIDPPLLESDIIRERLLFHRAVQRVETEYALRDTTLGSISKMQLEHRNPDAIPPYLIWPKLISKEK